MANSNGGFVGIDYEPESGTQDAVITTFNSSGTLTTAARTTAVQYVIVAGGGAGGANGNGSGGGGAGGYRSSVPGEASGGGASAESLSSVSGATGYPIVVGAGGAGTTSDGARGQVAVLHIQQVVEMELQVKGIMVVHHPMLVAQIMVAEAVVEQVK